MSYRPIVPVQVRPVEQLHELVPFEHTPLVNVRELGDTAKTISVVTMQSNIVCAWLASRPEEREIDVVQDISTGSCFFRRSITSRIRVRTR